jgi:hypothetical protein
MTLAAPFPREGHTMRKHLGWLEIRLCTHCSRPIWGKESLMRGAGRHCRLHGSQAERERKRLEAQGQMSLLEYLQELKGAKR